MNSIDIQYHMKHVPKYQAGQQVIIRDALWTIKAVKTLSNDNQLLICNGLSEIVSDKEFHFITKVEKDIKVLDPKKTELIVDDSPHYRASRLLIESHLRQTVENDEKIHIGHNAAIDYLSYQFEPARQALRQPRQRILIADGVGIGKTIEAGILVSELIARGRGRRILVLAVKSMLLQFQKEFWYRFTIPLTRLDSLGLQRIKSQIPSNHNPFYYYDRSIISIDTMKARKEYLDYVREAYWDIIIIDEAHNVAKRGSKTSQRAKLAQLIRDRSDTLIMLSATPHDGRSTSFASLVNMLDETAISDPENFVEADYSDKELVIRRFKKDIESEVGNSFHPLRQLQYEFEASTQEERVYNILSSLRKHYREARHSSWMIGITLEKGFLSSPAACIRSVENRMKDLERRTTFQADRERKILEELLDALAAIKARNFSKYQGLLELIKNKDSEVNWSPRTNNDRLVIFTERIATLKWLYKNFKKDLNLKQEQIEMLHGTLPDLEIQRVVDDFGNTSKKLRLLICSDVASEGINLHYLSHRLVHFDLPWSIMLFQQRNGRIDRYGQEKVPTIVYLINKTNNQFIERDIELLNRLRKKYEQAVKDIGDPANLLGLHSIKAEEELTSKIIARELDESELDDNKVTDKGESFLNLFLGISEPSSDPSQRTADRSTTFSLFRDDLAYCEEGFAYLKGILPDLHYEINQDTELMRLRAPDDLIDRFQYFPKEIRINPRVPYLNCTSRLKDMYDAMEKSRSSEVTWPDRQYLWRLSPIVAWLDNRLLTALKRNHAPILTKVPSIGDGEIIFLMSGLVFNERSHPLIHRLIGIRFSKDQQEHEILPIEEVLHQTKLNTYSLPNPAIDINFDSIKNLREKAVDIAFGEFKELRDELEIDLFEKRILESERFEKYKNKHAKISEHAFRYSPNTVEKDEETLKVERRFHRFWNWVKSTLSTNPYPTIKLICVMTG